MAGMFTREIAAAPPMPAIKPARQDLSGLSIRQLDLRPGDRLVATYPGRLTHEQIHTIRQELEQWAPGVKCVVVQQGVTIEAQPAQASG